MKNFILITPFLTLILILIFLQHHLVAAQSPIQQKIALFQFKQCLNISTTPTYCDYFDSYFGERYSIPSYPKTMNWSMSSDHCTWEGVTCQHNTGHVIGLDLSCSQLEGAILPNSTLFQLSHLRFLNLSHNDFSSQFPQEFGFFAKGLTHLNLSFTLFSGRVPSGISHLHKLVSLDLKYGAVKLENEDFKSILQNLTQLRVLNLDGVNISSVLPMNLSTSLRVLNLMETDLHGVLSQEVFHLPNIELLALGVNTGLEAVLPKVKWGSSGTLQHLFLPRVHIYGGIPDSIGFLDSLVSLELSYCNLSGPIPKSLGNLGQLTYLGLTGNNFSGPIPKFLANLTNLRYLFLSQNNFTGPFLSSVAHFKGLIQLGLGNNGFTGLLPTGLFNHPSLEVLVLGNNGFTGQLYDFNSTNSQLMFIDCDNNLLYGPIPQSFSQLVNLTYLDLSSNNFSGPIPQSFSQLVNLTWLDLSSNNFSGVLDMKVFSRLESLEGPYLSHNSLLSGRSSNTTTLPPKLEYLDLSSCNMKEFPHFSRDAEISLGYVDLSNNEIEGEIPHWIGSVGVGWYLNISHNRLTGGLEKLPWNNIQYLDLQSNKLNGSLPTLICNSSFLEILNLSNNSLTGVLPVCRKNLTNLSVFDLRMNKIEGNIPATLSNFRSLETINLNGNRLEGRIPSSFAEFDYLRVLDLGNNQINDTFPQCLEALPNLQVLVLKSNKFHGIISKSSEVEHPFPSLRIIDLSYNDFSGPLPAMYFKNFTAMMNGDVNGTKPRYFGGNSYSDSTSLVIKGVEIELVRILTMFPTIDVSSNNFEGKIVDYIGNLVSLKSLNFSYNRLTGGLEQLPWNNIQFLDLQSNKLNGSLPALICNSSSLEILNLSNNNLSGVLPICQTELSILSVLDLRMNGIQGSLPSNLSNFRNLKSINLHGNKLEGRFPPSFAEFDNLETLDLGNNKINDTFPQCLEALPNLRVLVLKSNKFHGIVNKNSGVDHPFPSLRIIDLSNNEFSGPLPAMYFKNFEAMMIGDVNERKARYMGDSIYRDSTSLVIKGVEIELVRILTVFTTIDVSSNNFEGKIVDYIGNLVSVRLLNLSHNYLAGHIPSSVGNLSMLESLDLSSNQLEGEIPQELTSIYTLECLNLSRNQLSGRIPQGFQFNTFDSDSYGGNLGLCGYPLSKTCEHDIGLQTQDENGDDDYFFDGFTWQAVVIGYGCGVVPAFIIGNLMLLAGKPKWFAGIIARELGLKIRRMEIKWR